MAGSGGDLSVGPNDGSLTLQGSALAAGGNVKIHTGGDLNLLAAQSTRYESIQSSSVSSRKSESLSYELDQTRALLSTITAGNGVDLQVGGDVAAQVGTKDSQGNLQADRMTADGVVKGADRQQVAVSGSGADSSRVLGNLSALGIRNGAVDSFAPGAVSSGQAAMAMLLQNGLVSIRNHPDIQAVLAVPGGAAMTYRDASGKVQLTVAGQAKVQEVYSQLRLSEVFHEEHFADAGVAQVVTLVAAIALTVTIPGAGAAMFEAAGGTMTAMTATMANAAFISTTSTMVGQLAGGASFGDAFESAMKAGVTSSVTAGILNTPMVDTANGVQSINQVAGIQDVAGTGAKMANFDVAGLGQNLPGMVARGVVTAGVSTAINGGDFGDALKSSVVSDLAAVGANAVGQSGLPDGARALAHAGVGCAAAAANGKDCAAGAIGAAGASLFNPVLDEAIGGADGSGWGDNPALRTATLQLSSMAVTGALASALGKDGMTAALAAQNETVNNYLGQHPINGRQKSEQQIYDEASADCFKTGNQLACNLATNLRKLSGLRDDILAIGCANGSSDCNTQVRAAIASGNKIVQLGNGTVTATPPGTPYISNTPNPGSTLFDTTFQGSQSRNLGHGLAITGVTVATITGGGMLYDMGLAAQTTVLADGVAGITAAQWVKSIAAGGFISGGLHIATDPNASPASTVVNSFSGMVAGPFKLGLNAGAGLANQWIPTTVGNLITYGSSWSVSNIINNPNSVINQSVNPNAGTSTWTSPVFTCGPLPRNPC